MATVRKLCWFFLLITLIVGANHLFGTGYFTRRAVTWQLRMARREVSMRGAQEILQRAISALDKYVARVQKLSFIYKQPNFSGVYQVRRDLSYWTSQDFSTETEGLPGQGQRTVEEYFADWAENYRQSGMPSLGVMSPEMETKSRYACYVLIPITLLLMLIVFLGPRIE